MSHFWKSFGSVSKGFQFLQTFGELEERISARQAKLQQHGISLQPFAAIVGVGSESVGHYIIVDNIKYKVENILRCLELLFKLFHAWNIEYLPESENIWIFIQEMAFKMKSF